MKKLAVLAAWLLAQGVFAQWSSVGGGMSTYPYELYWDSVSQRLYNVGGMQYALQESLLVNGTCYYENDAWHPMGSGSTPYPGGTGFYPARAVTRYDSAIVVAGSFPLMDSVAGTWQVAQWKDSTWFCTGLDSGTFDEVGLVTNLTVLDDKLHVLGGMNWVVDDVPIDNWATWDGEHWAPGDTTGMFDFDGGQVNQVCDFQGMRYVCGNFQQDGYPNDLARWNGSVWEEVGAGINGDPWVNEMVVYDNKLWVCGEFAASWGNAASGLMAWDGTQWLNPFPQIAFTAAGKDVITANGKLYFAGPFVAQGLSGVYRFGVFDGQTLCVFGGPNCLDAGNITASTDTFYAYCAIIGEALNNVAQWPLNGPMDTCYQVVQGVPGNIGAANVLSVFPNPAADRVTFAMAHGADRFTVLDGLGRTVLGVVPDAFGKATVDVRDLAGGLYHVEARNAHGALVAHAVFVKER